VKFSIRHTILTSYPFLNASTNQISFKVKKGVKSGVVYDPALQRVEKRLAEKISEINLPFEEELKTIEED
jgi:hypothetical protein